MPEGLDLFSWSLPFLAEKVTSMLYNILKTCTPAELEATEDTAIPEELKQMLATKPEEELESGQAKMKRRMVLKNKI